MRRWKLVGGWSLALFAFASVPAAWTQAGSQAGAVPPQASTALGPMQPDPAIAAAVRGLSAEAVRADIAALVGFGTRSTLSSMDTDQPAGHGIRAAADWIEAQFRAMSAACGGCLEVKRDVFNEEPAAAGAPKNRYARRTQLTNVYAILHGSVATAPWTLVTGHYDSRVNDVMDSHAPAPGANDDASGVAVSLECARALSGLRKNGLALEGTVVFVAVAGEEQGLSGSAHLAKLARAEGWPLVAVLNNDIVGGDTTPPVAGSNDPPQDKTAVRLFSESVPATATPEQVKQTLGLGAEGDSPSRELAREVAELAPAYFAPGMQHSPTLPNGAHNMLVRQVPAFHPVLELRRDRYLRGGDHSSFNAQGFAAVRFTEWRENFDHQHQAVRVENGVQMGDLLQFVDTAYVANVAKLNAVTLATLAAAPGEPRNVRVLTKDLDNNSELKWDAPAFAPAGTTYEVVWRATGDLLWKHAQSAGTATDLKLNVSKDNVLFGVRAVDADGHRSLPVPPLPARE